jgi:hypothetical protein
MFIYNAQAVPVYKNGQSGGFIWFKLHWKINTIKVVHESILSVNYYYIKRAISRSN